VVCAALALLFLYNPFLETLNQHAQLTVCHPDRHRATVGASELEQFARPSGVAVPLPDVEAARMFLEVASADAAPARYDVVREEGVPVKTGFSLSLWFRPPPAV
jgi:hypothetical protein